MPPRTFDTLVQLVGPHIRKKDTNFRKAISPERRLAQTVRFLAAGETLRSSCFSFLNGRSTACGIVSSIASDFEERWNMPHCVGAINGKHVAIECPPKSGSEDYNYKNCFSKSLLAISDACYSCVKFFPRAAYRVRDLLAKYFVTDGKIPWQEYMIKDRTLCSGVTGVVMPLLLKAHPENLRHKWHPPAAVSLQPPCCPRCSYLVDPRLVFSVMCH
ncbi:hypothetical protein HPB49_010089 [Dermacentor silvarum]|uniref:Uncharacterized protein n=1 Tax=Dermacentor silvarum TaxID=543639 RepID=A0ACB8CEL2_DERSI|nr:hypothetical protein HPB49_010089 [Dermacentor silvarum]